MDKEKLVDKPTEKPGDRPTFNRRLATVLLISSLASVAAMLTFEKLVWQKILTELVLPVSLCWLMVSACLVAAWVGKLRWHTLGLAITWLTLTVCANNWIGDAFIGTLENQFLDHEPLQMERFDTLIVLGGGTASNKRMRSQLGAAGDRIAVAAQMYHAAKVDTIIVTGKTIAAIEGDDAPDPSEQASDLLISLGVDEQRIQRIGGRHTLEEMSLLAEILPRDQRIGLITSAWHLPRALRRARAVDLNVIPVPADFGTGVGRTSILSLIPRYEGFRNTSRALKEYLGMAVGR